ncbi:hypothetical protein PYW08_004393 [Mythimna loreyi]|uniref:Uncharacterized protein n=1 Tax=Mythimna loreyi TaxID=667449 RepID=A0ACC2QPD3_9NEOP|nr:hypothetical protein PYW08_004393 [Mythimna loreyi]
MKRGLVVFLAMCALAIAMVPRDRRAVNPDEQEKPKADQTVCAHSTPCAWSVYKPGLRIIDLNITNTYCICSADTECVYDEDDVNSIVFRCRAPKQRTSDS